MSQQLTQPAESAVQRSMNRNNYMLSARDIFKTLKELKQNKKLSNRRWVGVVAERERREERLPQGKRHNRTHP